ncbi:hypothetical protein ASNO1_62740 [Corallococcus caeni]|uniref:Uncharacterized protein n=1 Tax=Corallococcus caeni TaxID=3082388 RepID=A0ABQ6R142_9BACT|nr:hypothetical protein ASNO1_62740 [Corallococcus sp. NO1]
MTQAALRLQFLDELLERQVLVLVGGQGGVAHPGQQLPERELRRDVGAKHEGVDEEADEAFRLSASTACDGRTDGDVLLAGVARQQHLEGGQQGHEGRDAFTLAEVRERIGQGQVHGQGRTALGLHCGTRLVRGQLQQGGRAGELLLPVPQLCLQHLPLQP